MTLLENIIADLEALRLHVAYMGLNNDDIVLQILELKRKYKQYKKGEEMENV